MKTNPRQRKSDSNPSRGEFEDFYNEHYAAVSRYVARRLPKSSHDEVVAAAFVVAWRKFASATGPSLAWLYRIASYEVAHERRRLGRQPQVAELNDLHLIDIAPLDEVIDVSRAFSQLSESDAELLRLVYWENLGRTEIAEVLGVSVSTANVRHHRALGRLSGALHRLASVADSDESTIRPFKEIQ
ncbi:MAG TPA: sigma-70 family RNA polymerase sigma factor [Acidimicrobiales bacterium]|nr:sigma-70 family RNA polymerase sigma factor [Acidimicrobiales bacterium]